MAKIYSDKIKLYLKDPRRHAGLYLLHGPDAGNSEIICKDLTNSVIAINSQARVVNLNYADVKNDMTKIATEVYNLEWGCNFKILVLKNFTGDINKELEHVFSKIPNKVLIIITSSELASSNKLRKMAETDVNMLSCASYFLDKNNIKIFIREYLDRNKLSYEPQVLEIIASNLEGDRLMINSELEKISTYFSGEKITQSALEEIIISNHELDLDSLILYIISQNKKEAFQILKKINYKELNQILFIRQFMSYVSKLMLVHENNKQMNNIEAAIEQLKPVLFFKYKPIFKQILKMRNMDNLLNYYDVLLEYEKKFKLSSNNQVIFENFILKLLTN